MGSRGIIRRIAVVLVAVVLAALLLGGASASGSDVDCQYGAISALGPVDAEGNGDTTPVVSCIGP